MAIVAMGTEGPESPAVFVGHLEEAIPFSRGLTQAMPDGEWEGSPVE